MAPDPDGQVMAAGVATCFCTGVPGTAQAEHRSRNKLLRDALQISVIFYLFVIFYTGTAHTETVGGWEG